jgi:hypothetical protein
MILGWADAHHAATGQWPTYRTGRVHQAPCKETWRGINLALTRGWWGLPGGQCLAWLLHEHRQVKPHVSRDGSVVQVAMRRRLNAERPDGRESLTVEQILLWADQHHAATGTWPKASTAEPIPGVRGENWSTIDAALMHGRCGLPGGSSLSRLLDERRPWGRRSLATRTTLAWKTTPIVAQDAGARTAAGSEATAPET